MRRPALPLLLLLAGCVHGGADFRITPDATLLAGRDRYVSGAKLTPARKLNVVLLVADDLGRHDTTMYGEPGTVTTPSLERLAREGVTFAQGYVTAPICSPSRAGLLTGRYQQRFGHEGQPHERYAHNGVEYFFFKNFIATGDWVLKRAVAPDDEDVQRQGLPKSELTLAEVLQRHGYATGAFGKWHLGWNDDFVPHHRGFDEHFGYYEAFSLYQQDIESESVVNQHHSDFSDRFIWGKGRGGTAAIRRNGTVVDEPGYLTDRLADEAIAFIARHKAEPFFLYVPFPNPHTPFQAKKSLYDRFPEEKDVNRRVYKALIASLDENVGRILTALDEQGVADDTLVLFISDNGGAEYTHAVDNAPLQGGKMTLFEGGLRVPFALRWPGHAPAGTRFDAPVSTLDLMATVAAATGATLPDDRPYDGVDLLPFVRGEREGVPHEALFWRAEYAHAVRKGPWKLVESTDVGAVALFDLSTDPGETKDLSKAQPDVVKALEADFAQWETQCRAPLWPHVMEYRFKTEDGREFWYPL
jgi:arylsulfatase A-like enzyme